MFREQASSASGVAASGMSSDERNQVSYLLVVFFTDAFIIDN